MNEKFRIPWIFTKWVIYGILIYYLYQVKFFHFLFIWLPWLITYTYDLIVTYGLIPVLRAYDYLWFTAAILLIIFFFLFFETIYRIKRKDFRIGGELEGRIIWAKGIRKGLIYDLWDVKNFLYWLIHKKKDTVLGNPHLLKNMVNILGIKNPWEIPIGPKNNNYYILYVRRGLPFLPPRVPERWFIPIKTKIASTLFTISLPETKIITKPHPVIPGRYDYHIIDKMPRSDMSDPSVLTKKNRRQLKRSAELVEFAVGSDSETKKADWVYGSFDIPQLKEEEGAND